MGGSIFASSRYRARPTASRQPWKNMGLSPQWREPSQIPFLLAASAIRCGISFTRHVGPLLTCFGFGLFLSVTALFAYAVVPVISATSSQYLLHMAATLFLSFNIYFNYALSIASDPGVIQSEEADQSDSEDETSVVKSSDSNLISRSLAVDTTKQHAQDTPDLSPSDKGLTYCRSCRTHRPQRAHHCSVCDVCIDSMDHHCPWVNNCIGRGNYRYFFSLMFWLSVASIYAAMVTYTPAFGELNRRQYSTILFLFNSSSIPPAIALQFIFIMSVAAAIGVGILQTWQIYLVLTAQTSIEFHLNSSPHRSALSGNRRKSPYHRGSMHKNWELVFGPTPMKLLSLLPSTRSPPRYYTKSSVSPFHTFA